jgi:hypothetical protein
MKKTFIEYKKEFFKIAEEEYLMYEDSFEESELKNAFEDGETPQEYMEWFASKYDLINVKEII